MTRRADENPMIHMVEELSLIHIAYRVLRCDVALGHGARAGQVVLALPAEGRGRKPIRPPAEAEAEAQAGPAFVEALAAQVEAADCVLDAVLARVTLSLTRVLDLAVGEVLTLPRASIDRLSFVGLDGRTLSEGKLGQQRGMRAIRLTEAERPAKAAVSASVQAVAEPAAQAQRKMA